MPVKPTTFYSRLYYFAGRYPLGCIMAAGLFFRLLAAVFSKGYGMVDDHFLIIEQAQSWLDHVNVNDWLPQLSTNAKPPGFSFFYTGLHYLLFRLLQSMGIYSPDDKMYIVRVLHALYSMITVYCGYRIAARLSSRRSALQVGLLLSLLWVWPFLCVRNLVEVTCIPMLMLASWMAVKHETATPALPRRPYGSLLHYAGVGIVLGLAFNIRFQTLFFSSGFLLALLLQKKPAKAVACGFGLLLCASVFQGGIDWYIWHRPFVELRGYVQYNLQHSTEFITLPWFNYLLLFAGILIPPVSLLLLTGFFTTYKKYLPLFLPTFTFLLFHSWFPNKQERFILPILPFIILLGVIGWNELAARKGYAVRYRKALRNMWAGFYILNAALLIVASLAYSKRNRVEAMVYLARRGDVRNLLVENTSDGDAINSPRFYLGSWPKEYFITALADEAAMGIKLQALPDTDKPNYILLYESRNLPARLAALQRYFNISYQATVYPSFADWFMHRINPVNENGITYIYKIER